MRRRPLTHSDDSETFFLDGGRVGCLLLHGLTATPQEMRWLGAELHAAGHTVLAPRVAGHGTAVEDLAETTWHDWLASARDALAQLQQQCDRVVVGGLSMGSLLALNLAHENPHSVQGVVAMATALWVSDRRMERYRWLLAGLGRTLPLHWASIPKGGRDVADPEARAASITYERFPFATLATFVQLQRHTRPLLTDLRVPVLAVHGRQDHTCPVENVDYLAHHLPLPPRVVLLDRSYHIVTVDYDKEVVAGQMLSFIAAVAEDQRRAATAG